jgi:hypothetical protein
MLFGPFVRICDTLDGVAEAVRANGDVGFKAQEAPLLPEPIVEESIVVRLLSQTNVGTATGQLPAVVANNVGPNFVRARPLQHDSGSSVCLNGVFDDLTGGNSSHQIDAVKSVARTGAGFDTHACDVGTA